MHLKTVKIEKPDDTNFVLGQTHFIKSVEDIPRSLVDGVLDSEKLQALALRYHALATSRKR